MCSFQNAFEQSPLRVANPRKPRKAADGGEPLGVIKWHMVSHFASFIVLFGSLMNTHVGNLETFHKWIKMAYRRYTSKVEENLAQQIPKFFARHAAYQTLRAYDWWRALVQPCENIPPAKRSRTVASPATSAHGRFYVEKGVPQSELKLQQPNAPAAPTWDFDSLNIPSTRMSALSTPAPPLIIRGVSVTQVSRPSPPL